MAKKSVQPEKTVLDDLFYIPDDAVDFVYSDDTDIIAENDDVNSVDDFFGSTGYDSSDDAYLPVPNGIKIVSQTIRTAPGGAQVVDVVIEIDDIDGVERFEPRLTIP